jgi:hypothetical protein
MLRLPTPIQGYGIFFQSNGLGILKSRGQLAALPHWVRIGAWLIGSVYASVSTSLVCACQHPCARPCQHPCAPVNIRVRACACQEHPGAPVNIRVRLSTSGCACQHPGAPVNIRVRLSTSQCACEHPCAAVRWTWTVGFSKRPE